MCGDQPRIDFSRHERRDVRSRVEPIEQIQSAGGEIGDARCEAKAKQVAQRKYMVR